MLRTRLSDIINACAVLFCNQNSRVRANLTTFFGHMRRRRIYDTGWRATEKYEITVWFVLGNEINAVTRTLMVKIEYA